MDKVSWKKIQNFFNSILHLEEIKTFFKFRNRIVLVPGDKHFLSIFIDNLEKINFSEKVEKIDFNISIEKSYNYFKKQELKIKKWLILFFQKRTIEIFINKNEKIFKENNLKIDSQNFTWNIEMMELGKIGKLLTIILHNFSNLISPLEYSYLLKLFDLKEQKELIFLDYFWTFAIVRNSFYHYSSLDLCIFFNSFKLVENYISLNLEKVKFDLNELYFKYLKNTNFKFSLEFQDINFFKKSFDLINYFLNILR